MDIASCTCTVSGRRWASTPKHAAAIESALGESSIFGTAVSPGDVILAAYLDLAVEMQADCLDAFPKTKGLWEKVATNANVIKVKEGKKTIE